MDSEKEKERRTPKITFMKDWKKLHQSSFFTVRIYYQRLLFRPYQVIIVKKLAGLGLLLSNTKIALKKILSNKTFVKYDAETDPEHFYKTLEGMYGFNDEYNIPRNEDWNGKLTAMSILGFIWLNRVGKVSSSRKAPLTNYFRRDN